MKSLSAATLAHLQGESTTFTVCWLIQRRDTVVKGFTANVADLIVNVPGFGNITFRAGTGATVSNLQTSTGRGIDNLSAYGSINSGEITEADLLRGLYDDARVIILLVNYADPSQQIILVRGFLGEVKIGRRAFETEVRSLIQRAAQTVGQACSPLCRVKNLGDAECTVALAGFTFAAQVVASVVSRSQFRTASAGVVGKPATYFAYGNLTWTSGANNGKSTEIRNHDTSSPCLITLAEIMPFTIQINDQFTIVAGCDRTITSCQTKFSNILNFRGEPFIPGVDTVLKVI